MRNLLRVAVFALGAVAPCFGLAGAAQAEPQMTVDIDTSAYSDSAGGGEFKITAYDGSVAGQGAGVSLGGVFQTFCLETTESIGERTFDYTIDTSAIAGGYSGGNPDPLDERTAYLYTQFWNGTLSGYNYTAGAGRTASALALQLAIWKLEGEIHNANDGNPNHQWEDLYNGNATAQGYVTQANNALVANGGTWSGIGTIRVLNLQDTGGSAPRQSLLVNVLPLPSAAWLGLGMMSAMGAVGIIRRRRRQALA